MRTIRDSIERSRASAFVGRERELARLQSMFEPDGPLVLLLHGVGGIGKSSLLRAFESDATARGRQVRRLDCRSIKPVPDGLLEAIGASLQCKLESIGDAAGAISALNQPVVFALDNYEALRLLDGWLRTEFLPSLPSSARFIVVGRSLPMAPWISEPGWADLVFNLRLSPLPEADVTEYLASRGFPVAVQARIARFSKGNPLALQLCTASLAEQSTGLGTDFDLHQVIEHLAHACVSEIEDSELKDAIEVASVVRRVTRPILKALLPDRNVDHILSVLRELSFVETAADGLVFHDSFRLAIETRLAAIDPVRYRMLKRAAWKSLRDQLRTASTTDTWRHTADLLFLLERPVIREAFFPSSPTLPVEKAKPRDRDSILEISRLHDGEKGAAIMAMWWDQAAACFSVVRGSAGEVNGFYVLARPQDVRPELANADPLLRNWLATTPSQGVSVRRPVLMIRNLLGRAHGESQSPEWAACVLDAKRAYLENPAAIAVYTAIRDPATAPPAVKELGFEPRPELTVFVDGRPLYTASLNFGANGPLDWILDFVGRDLQDREAAGAAAVELDVSKRGLIVKGGGRFGLTKLEFDLMLYLSGRPGVVVTRDELLREVWKQPFGGSNVVDVVVRSVRKKLGESAWVISTVKGHGYRFVHTLPESMNG
ncbi:MAG: winged helix-turn-helix domain-containing protein [Bryobacteraceae bacterium]